VKTIKDDLTAKMNEASERLDFEKAMDYRDQIKYIEATVEKQNIMNADFTNRDVFSYVVDRGWISIQVFLLRQSTIIKREAAMFPIYDQIEDEVLSFIIQFYEDQNHILPKEILVPEAIDQELLSETLGVKVMTPKRGSKKRMLDLATQNSEISLNEKFRREEQSQLKTKGALEALGLEKVSVIESFDHSNIQGTNPVSAMVVFKDGKPDRKNYRKFKVKTVVGSHEFATTQEVIRRRYSRLLREGARLPDLILMDGGKIQMRAALEVLEDELGLEIPVCGMVKNEKHKTATLLYGEDYKEIDLDRKGQAFQLIQRVQEEVHRFAITFHRQLRSKNTFASKLEMIDGVGPKTRKKLLRHFKTITAMKQASLEELQSIGISERVARNILEELGK